MSKPYADHIYDALPARYRAQDKTGLLKRIVSLFGDMLAEC